MVGAHRDQLLELLANLFRGAVDAAGVGALGVVIDLGEPAMEFGARHLGPFVDDRIAPDTGFPPHPHADMEIITYVTEGAVTHEDSLGNQGRTAAGDVQVMSAGTGIRHAEYNREPGSTSLFQIWILPTSRGQKPSWGTRPFPKGDRSGRFVALASGFEDDGEALPLRTDARVLGATVPAGETVEYRLGRGRHGYLVPAKGSVEVNGVRLDARDGAAIRDEEALRVRALDDAELVLVDAA